MITQNNAPHRFSFWKGTPGSVFRNALLLGGALTASSGFAATINQTASDVSPASTFLNGTNFAPAETPTSVNQYVNSQYIMQTPASDASCIFGGGLLILGDGMERGKDKRATLLYKGTANSTVTIGALRVNNGNIVNSSDTPGATTMTLAGTITVQPGGLNVSASADGTHNRVVNIDSVLEGPGKIIAYNESTGGTGVIVFGASNDYTGGTIIGTSATNTAANLVHLQVAPASRLGSGGTVNVLANGALTLNGADNLGLSQILVLDNDLDTLGRINLNYTGTSTINALSLNGGATFVAPGTYGAPNSGATFTSTFFSGKGLLKVSATAITPVAPVSGYYLTFRDEFDSLSMQNPLEEHIEGNASPQDTSRGWWRPLLPWGGVPGNAKHARYHHPTDGAQRGEEAWYVWNQYKMPNGVIPAPDTYTVDNGILTVKTRPFTTTESSVMTDHTKRGIHHWSGLFTTFPTFSQQYGYFEMRAKMPVDGKGLFPAFWLLPDDWTWPPEIDIFEFIGKVPGAPQCGFDSIFQTVHWMEKKKTNSLVLWTFPDKQRADTDFHIYGFEWLPNLLIWYVDGVETRRFQRDIAKPMYIIINTAIGGSWATSPNAKTTWPALMQIDYVRVFSTTKPSQILGPVVTPPAPKP